MELQQAQISVYFQASGYASLAPPMSLQEVCAGRNG
jgi:hypothetical protein